MDTIRATTKEVQAHSRSSSPNSAHKSAGAIVNEKPVSSIHDDDSFSAPWTTGLKARFPWSGFAALFMVLVCIGLNILILVTSNNQTQETWPSAVTWNKLSDGWKGKAQLKPSVALAVTNTVTNLALAAAMLKGISISWWRRCLHGSTISTLHSSWSFSASFWELLTAGKKFNLIALAAIALKIALVDSILLQQAASTVPGTYLHNNPGNLLLPIVDEIPAGFASRSAPVDPAFLLSQGFVGDLYRQQASPLLIPIEDDYDWPFDWSSVVTGCYGVCSNNVTGFGFDISCDPITKQDSIGVLSSDADSASIPVMSSNTTRIDAGGVDATTNQTFARGAIKIATSWAVLTSANGSDVDNAQSCSMSMAQRTCYLQPAKVKYSIAIADARNPPPWIGNPIIPAATGTSNGLVLDTGYEPQPDYYYQDNLTFPQAMSTLSPAYQPWDPKFADNMQAFADGISSFYSASAGLQYSNITGFVPTPLDASPLSSWWLPVTEARTSFDTCVMHVQDPMSFILDQVSAVMLRSSISAAFTKAQDGVGLAPNPANLRSFSMDAQLYGTVQYKSQYMYLAAASAVMFLCVLLILPSYWGFWELGREVTMNPLEVAGAFQAPVLQGPSDKPAAAAGEVGALLEAVGDRRVAYGVTEDGHLAVLNEQDVTKMLGLRMRPTLPP